MNLAENFAILHEGLQAVLRNLDESRTNSAFIRKRDDETRRQLESLASRIGLSQCSQQFSDRSPVGLLDSNTIRPPLLPIVLGYTNETQM